MKIVVALDSFKGSVSARVACAAVRRGIVAVLPAAQVVELPMADGGEGTAEAVLAATGGDWVALEVTGPLPDMRVEAGFARLPARDGGGPGALVEMAKASGIELLEPDRLDPLRTTTLGTGELVAAALRDGARTVWLAIGGSATVDGGMGLARAMGWRFLDRDGADVGPGGGALERIERIARPTASLVPARAVEVLCDVDNPLVGPRGAARVFGPQKGATPGDVERLEAGLAKLADVIEQDLGLDVRDVPGAGAAGGLGAGAIAFLDATLVSGAEAVMGVVGLEDALRGADWVVTGEGRMDEQSLHGKVVSGVASRARGVGCRIAVVAGSVALDGARAGEAGIEVVEPAAPPGMPLDEAVTRGEELIEGAARRLAARL